MADNTAAFLRSIPTLTGNPPAFQKSGWAADPSEQFLRWLHGALSVGVSEPHAAVLSTVDEAGVPDGRALILKNVDASRWSFAGPATSAKGRQLAERPAAALTFWWPPVVRSARVRGARVVAASPEESAADLAARSQSAQADVHDSDWTLWRLIADRGSSSGRAPPTDDTLAWSTHERTTTGISASRGLDALKGLTES